MDQKTYTKDELVALEGFGEKSADNLLKAIEASKIVALIDRIGCNSGGEFEVTGLNGGESHSVMVAQTEWYDTPVCFVGGYGNPVAAIVRDKVAEKLPDVLDDYFDRDSVFTVEPF